MPVTTRAASAVATTSTTTSESANSSSNNSNYDMIFIPPRTPVRSKTKETQGYHTPSKLVTKSGKINFNFLKFINLTNFM